jgi:uncharacterized protein YcbK (DUF882 family)
VIRRLLVLFGVALASVALSPPLLGQVRGLSATLGALDAADARPRRPTFGTSPLGPVPMPEIPEPRLQIEALDGKPIVDVRPFDAHGNPRPEALAAISRAFRAPSGEEVPVDPRLVEILVMMQLAAGGRPLALVSGHREAGRGTGKKSYHVRGMAADIAVRGMRAIHLQKAAVRLGVPGVGYYGSFVHVDARRDRPYRWSAGRRRR